MLMTPTTILAISFAGLAFGVVLTWWGKRGKPIDEHPVCRKCRFDLVGRPPEGDRCPECGANLGRRRAIATGNRKPRLSAIVIGGCISILAVCVFGGWGWVRFRYAKEADKPTWLVLLDSRSKDSDFRSAALTELSGRQKTGQLSDAQCDAYVDRLGELLQSDDFAEQNGALEFLKDAGPMAQRAIPAIVPVLARADPPETDKWAAILMGESPGELAASLLDSLGAIGRNAMLEEVRRGSHEALKHWLSVGEKVNDERIAQLLLEALNSKDGNFASDAQIALNSWPGRFPYAPALAGLSNLDPKTRIASLRLLPRLDRNPPLDALWPLLHDRDPDVQFVADEALAISYLWTTDPRAQQWLIEILRDGGKYGRIAAADALSRYTTPETIKALSTGLNDPDPDVCAVSGHSLEKIGGEAAFEAVIDVLDEEPENFHGFVEALADRLCKGSYKNTPYWKKHEAMKHPH